MIIVVTRDAQFLAPELREMCVLVLFGAACKYFAEILSLHSHGIYTMLARPSSKAPLLLLAIARDWCDRKDEKRARGISAARLCSESLRSCSA